MGAAHRSQQPGRPARRAGGRGPRAALARPRGPPPSPDRADPSRAAARLEQAAEVVVEADRSCWPRSAPPSAASWKRCSTGSPPTPAGPVVGEVADARRGRSTPVQSETPRGRGLDRRRLTRLFIPYRRRLGAVLGLILVSRRARHGVAVPAARGARPGDSRSRTPRCWHCWWPGWSRSRWSAAPWASARRCSRTPSASASCTTCGRPSTGTSSECRWRSSPGPAPVRSSPGSQTTSGACRAS